MPESFQPPSIFPSVADNSNEAAAKKDSPEAAKKEEEWPQMLSHNSRGF